MSNRLQIVDRNGVLLQAGQQLEIQWCVGPYGKTQVVKGKLVKIEPYYGVQIQISEPFIWDTKDGLKPMKVGALFSISLPGGPANGQFVCMRKHEDFEHGHEAWARVVPEPAAKVEEGAA